MSLITEQVRLDNLPRLLTGLTGGGSLNLDGILTTGLSTTPRTYAEFIIGGLFTVYALKAGTDAESSPTIIRPDDYNASTNAKVWERVFDGIGGTYANPSASVGLTAVNGSATTAMRSDGAPPIDVAIAPTWTGKHIFRKTTTQVELQYDASNTATLTVGATGNLTVVPSGGTLALTGYLIASTAGDGAITSQGTGSGSLAYLSASANVASCFTMALGSTFGGADFGGVTGNSQVVIEARNSSSLYIGTYGAAPIIFAQNRVEKSRFASDGKLLLGTTTSNGGLLESLSTTEQLRLSYDSTHYCTFTVLSTGNITVAPSAGTFLVTGGLFNSAGSFFGTSGRGRFYFPADGILTLYNDAVSGFTKLQFGGTSASYPALATNGNGLTCISADSTVYSSFQAESITSFTSAAVRAILLDGTSSRLSLGSNIRFDWSSTTDAQAAPDTIFKRYAAGVVSVANSTGDPGTGSLIASGIGIGTVAGPVALLQVRGAANKNWMIRNGDGTTGIELLAANDAIGAYTIGSIDASTLILNGASGGNVIVGTKIGFTTDTFVTRSSAGVVGLANSTGTAGTGSLLANIVTATSFVISGATFVITSDATVANTGTETTLLGTAGSGSKTLSANVLTVGKALRGILRGRYGSAVVPGTLRIKVKFGSTVILDTGAQSMPSTATDKIFDIDFDIICRTTGGSGTVYGQGKVLIGDASGLVPQVLPMVNTAVATVDTTATQVVDVTATWGTADVLNTVTVSVASLG